MEFPHPKGFPRDFPGNVDASNVSRDNVSRETGLIIIIILLLLLLLLLFLLSLLCAHADAAWAQKSSPAHGRGEVPGLAGDIYIYIYIYIYMYI